MLMATFSKLLVTHKKWLYLEHLTKICYSATFTVPTRWYLFWRAASMAKGVIAIYVLTVSKMSKLLFSLFLCIFKLLEAHKFKGAKRNSLSNP